MLSICLEIRKKSTGHTNSNENPVRGVGYNGNEVSRHYRKRMAVQRDPNHGVHRSINKSQQICLAFDKRDFSKGTTAIWILICSINQDIIARWWTLLVLQISVG